MNAILIHFAFGSPAAPVSARTAVGLAAFCLTIAFAASAAAQEPQDAGTAARQVIEASREWFDALAAADLEALDRLQTDDFLTVQQGLGGVAMVGKARQMETLRQLGEGRPQFQRDLSNVQVRAYGNVAVLTALATFRQAGSESDEPVSRAVTTEIWVNEGGRWRLAHFQPTAVPRPAPAK